MQRVETVETADLAGEPPLCVDLDDTLLLNDSLEDQVVWMVFHHPLKLLAAVAASGFRRAAFKEKVAGSFPADLVPGVYDPTVLQALREEHLRGRRLILTTASTSQMARRVADDLGIFSEVIASDGELNLKGEAKARRLVERFGLKGFDYAGDSRADIAVWKQARCGWFVGNAGEVLRQARGSADIVRILERPRATLLDLLRLLRPHQWAKNLLVFVPLLTAHLWSNAEALVAAFVTFISLSLTASAVYVLNDLSDLTDDRRHPRKRSRALASARVRPRVGLLVAALLIACAGTLVWATRQADVAGLLLVYATATLLYSYKLKRIELLDVFALASLYVLRIVIGGIAIQVEMSSWLLAFSLFFFLSLALVKRFCEASFAAESGSIRLFGRGYHSRDAEFIASLGSASGYIAVVVFALFLTSNEVARTYSRPDLLWLVCIILLYWISRVWLLTHRGRMNEDPVLFAVKDPVSYGCGFLICVVVLLAAVI